jgi:DNA-binding SARP family transcriptional activator
MPIQLLTFGGLQAKDETGELDRLLAQHSRAALFVYLAVERRVSRESVTAMFWPESDAENARHALRQSLYHLRKAVGGEWIESRAHELVVTAEVRTDAQVFMNALEHGDVAAATEVYRGPFLDGVHLVDLKPWENWVDSRRAVYARSFRKACRELLETKRVVGDLTGAVQVAERWAARDSADEEAQHRLIEALAAAGERTEALRQYEAYSRQLEPDGLQPLDETLELAERLRSNPAVLPTLRLVTAREQQVAAVVDPGAERTSTVRRPIRFLVAAFALLLLVATAWGLRQRQTAPTRTASAIAVLPFAARGSAIEYLGDGIVNLLAAALDGAGSLRPVDVHATFSAVVEAGGVTADPQQGDRIASRLGAGMYVLGGAVEAGGMLQIEAGVYKAGALCSAMRRFVAPDGCRPPEPIAKAFVSGPADSVFELVDKLAARLLGGLGDPSADRLLRTAALTTASLPAFKEYLQGEGLMRVGQFERAADAYLAAIAHDSTFALAHYRLGLAREWAPLPGEDRAASAAARHGGRLSARDHNLLEAFRQWRAGDAAEAERSYRAILARYPDDIDAWFQLGEILFHHGPLLGRRIEESEEAWRKMLAYEPRNLFALTHLARIAVIGRRASALDSLLAPFGQDELRSDRRLSEIVLLRAVGRGDTAEAHALAKNVRRWEDPSVWRVAVFLTAFTPDAALMRNVIHELTEDYATPALRADLHWFTSLLDLANGRSVAAEATRSQAVEAERAVPAEHRRWAFDPVTEWFAATLPLPYADSTLLRVRRRAASYQAPSGGLTHTFESELELGSTIQLEPLRQYTLGVLSVRLRDTASAATAAATLQRLAASGDANALVRDLDRGLRALLARERGRPQDALRLLQTLEGRDSQGDIAATPFVTRVHERYLHGEVLVSLGREAEALTWFESLGNGSVTELPLRAPSHLRQAEIHDHLGNRQQAARHYERLLELYRDVDPEFQPLVDAARRRLEVLTPRE